MKERLAATDFYKYLKCPHWPYWDIHGDPKDKGEVPPMLQKLREDGVIHEKAIVEKLGAFEEMASEGDPEALAAATLEAMRRGVPLIYQGTLTHHDWIGRPDLLRRVETPSRLGAWSYEAVDIKASRAMSEAQSYQLVFYALLLKEVQGLKPDVLRIINVDGDELAMPIDEAERGFFEVLERLLAIRAGEKPAPCFMSSCKDSPWFALCKKEAEDGDDISLIYKIYRNEAKRLREAGYGTLAKLAGADLAALQADVKGVTAHRLERLQLQAQSLRRKEILRIDEPRLPETDAEIHFDIEGDPMIGVEYLHGLLIRERGKEENKAFAAEDPADEGRAVLLFAEGRRQASRLPLARFGRLRRQLGAVVPGVVQGRRPRPLRQDQGLQRG